MRELLLSFAMLALAAPVAAQAPEEPPAEPAEAAAETPGEASAPAPQVPLVDCPTEIDAEFLSAFGPPAGSLEPGRTVYMPPGATALGQQVGYVLVTGPGENGAADAPIRSIAYRLTGVNNPWGSEYSRDLREAFDKVFETDACSSASCMLSYRNPEAGQLSGAELSNRAPSIPAGAEGEAMPLLEADYDLDGADPVYLVCRYEAG